MNLEFDAQGLIPAIIQDVSSGEVLMMAWMSPKAYQLTVDTGEVHFWSRSRQTLWHKGKTSGNILQVQEILLDCDGDTLLVRVAPTGPACHTGARSCFFQALRR
jgi:phosphoribosyl-AMP cyclohydrolase